MRSFSEEDYRPRARDSDVIYVDEVEEQLPTRRQSTVSGIRFLDRSADFFDDIERPLSPRSRPRSLRRARFVDDVEPRVLRGSRSFSRSSYVEEPEPPVVVRRRSSSRRRMSRPVLFDGPASEQSGDDQQPIQETNVRPLSEHEVEHEGEASIGNSSASSPSPDSCASEQKSTSSESDSIPYVPDTSRKHPRSPSAELTGFAKKRMTHPCTPVKSVNNHVRFAANPPSPQPSSDPPMTEATPHPRLRRYREPDDLFDSSEDEDTCSANPVRDGGRNVSPVSSQSRTFPPPHLAQAPFRDAGRFSTHSHDLESLTPPISPTYNLRTSSFEPRPQQQPETLTPDHPDHPDHLAYMLSSAKITANRIDSGIEYVYIHSGQPYAFKRSGLDTPPETPSDEYGNYSTYDNAPYDYFTHDNAPYERFAYDNKPYEAPEYVYNSYGEASAGYEDEEMDYEAKGREWMEQVARAKANGEYFAYA